MATDAGDTREILPSSLILLPYVGPAGGKELVVIEVETGQFTVQGTRGRQFRYVVFN